MKREEAAVKIGANVPLPKDGYAIQCVEEEFKASQKGNMMIVRTWQIINPQFIEINGAKVDILGLELQPQYLTTKVFKKDADGKDVVDKEKTDQAMAKVFQDYEKLGLPCEEIDENNPPLLAKGIVAHAVCFGDEYSPTKAPTPEQLAKGQKYGDPITGEDGKPIKNFSSKIQGIYGLSKVAAIEGLAPF